MTEDAKKTVFLAWAGENIFLEAGEMLAIFDGRAYRTEPLGPPPDHLLEMMERPRPPTVSEIVRAVESSRRELSPDKAAAAFMGKMVLTDRQLKTEIILFCSQPRTFRDLREHFGFEVGSADYLRLRNIVRNLERSDLIVDTSEREGRHISLWVARSALRGDQT